MQPTLQELLTGWQTAALQVAALSKPRSAPSIGLARCYYASCAMSSRLLLGHLFNISLLFSYRPAAWNGGSLPSPSSCTHQWRSMYALAGGGWDPRSPTWRGVLTYS